MDNGTVAEVSNAGLITALVVGKTQVVGTAQGYDQESASEIVYSSVSLLYPDWLISSTMHY